MRACSVRSTQKVQVRHTLFVLTLFVSKGKLQTKSNKQAVFKIHRKEKFVKDGLFYLSYLPQTFYDHKLSFHERRGRYYVSASCLTVLEAHHYFKSSVVWEVRNLFCSVQDKFTAELLWVRLGSPGCTQAAAAAVWELTLWSWWPRGCILGRARENITEGALAWKQQLVSHPHHHSRAVPLTSTELQHSWFSVTWEQNWAYILLTGLFSSSFPYAVSMPVTGASWNWQQTQKALFSKPLDLKNFERMLQQAS